MDNYVPPPPVYDANVAAPPGYGAPQGSSKVAPSQDPNWIVPPPGAPPNRPATPDMEQGEASNEGKTKPVKNGRLAAFVSKIPKLR